MLSDFIVYEGHLLYDNTRANEASRFRAPNIPFAKIVFPLDLLIRLQVGGACVLLTRSCIFPRTSTAAKDGARKHSKKYSRSRTQGVANIMEVLTFPSLHYSTKFTNANHRIKHLKEVLHQPVICYKQVFPFARRRRKTNPLHYNAGGAKVFIKLLSIITKDIRNTCYMMARHVILSLNLVESNLIPFVLYRCERFDPFGSCCE